jgi:hypothetical protein
MAKQSPQFVLGGFVLEANAYAIDKFGRKTPYRWESQNRLVNEPALQFTGPGTETISLTGVAHLSFKGKMYQLDALREIAAEGKPKRLITGGGQNLGKFVITSISDSYSELMDDHRAKKNAYSIELKKYGGGTT